LSLSFIAAPVQLLGSKYLNIDAMSMIRGISKEKPALDFVLCIE
jgi:hypothetical protein